MLTFQANYLGLVAVDKVSRTGRLKKPKAQIASFVEINPSLKSDVMAFNQTAVKWDDKGGEGYAYDICAALNKGSKDRFFAITSQRDDFEKLDYNKILAMAQVNVSKDDEEFIEYLQTDPNNAHKSGKAKFSHIGTAMLNALKNLFSDKTISLDAVRSAIPFYLKNGFIDMGETCWHERRMQWKKPQ